MQAERDSEIYSLVGEHVIPVGQIKQGQVLNVFQADAEYYEFRFGNGTGFIAREDLSERKTLKRRVITWAICARKVFKILSPVARWPCIAKLIIKVRQSLRWRKTCVIRS